jgi:hypothetical protein
MPNCKSRGSSCRSELVCFADPLLLRHFLEPLLILQHITSNIPFIMFKLYLFLPYRFLGFSIMYPASIHPLSTPTHPRPPIIPFSCPPILVDFILMLSQAKRPSSMKSGTTTSPSFLARLAPARLPVRMSLASRHHLQVLTSRDLCLPIHLRLTFILARSLRRSRFHNID